MVAYIYEETYLIDRLVILKKVTWLHIFMWKHTLYMDWGYLKGYMVAHAHARVYLIDG